MSKLSFLDKLRILLKVSKSSNLYIIILILLIIVGILFLTTNKKNANRNKIIYASISAFIVVSLIATYHASLSNMFQYMMDNLFIVIYFPNLAIYLAALLATNIIVWISIFNSKTSKGIKSLNIAVFIIMNYLLALVLSIVNQNKLDIFTQSSVYGNKQATALIELSSLVFMVWIIFLVIYKILYTYLKKEEPQKVKKIIIRKKVKKLPENFVPLNSPSHINGTAPKTKVKIVEREIKVPEIRYVEKKSLPQQKTNLGDSLTLEDYKVVLKMLQSRSEKLQKEEKIKKELQQEQIKYDNMLKEQRKKEQSKYEELLSLYR